MIGLIKKDLLMIKGNIKILAILMLIYGAMALQGELDLSFILPFMCLIMMVSTFSYDTYNKWDAYVVTLPKGRKNSVKAKYLATLILVVIATIITTILGIIIDGVNSGVIDYEKVIGTIAGGFLATTLMQSLMFPAIYKFGVEKARIGIFIVVLLVVFVGGLIARYIDFTSLTKVLSFMDNYWVVVIPILMIVMLYGSYKISERIYMKKEF